MPSSHSLPAATPGFLECPNCPHCQARMALESVSPAPPGYDLRTFACGQCNRISTRLVPRDPMKTGDALQYPRSELRPPK